MNFIRQKLMGQSSKGAITTQGIPTKNGKQLTGEEADSAVKELAEKRLVDSQKESTAIEVDQRLFDGRRKVDRGFTVSIGKASSPSNKDTGMKRSMTLPARSSNRRGDVILTADTVKAIENLQATLKSRVRRGSISLGVSGDAEIENFAKTAKYHMYGKVTNGQAPASDKDIIVVGSTPAEKILEDMGMTYSCTKGCKGASDQSPNQDNFSLTRLANGWDIICVMDGHGPNGHHASYRTVRTLPYYLTTDPAFPKDMESAFKTAFSRCHADLVGHALQDGYDVQASGTTCVCSARLREHLWVGHTGDSRLVIGNEVNTNILFETKDHKPDTPSEKARVDASGGEVKTFKYDDNWSVSRVFVKGCDYPGLCMTRSLGDDCVKSAGVTAEPEVSHVILDFKLKPFLFMASDGVWEFLTSDLMNKTLSKKIPVEGAAKCLQRISKEARKRWKNEEGDYCDDITGIVALLKA